MNEYDARQYHVLALIEAAQRAGRDEREIDAIVRRYFGDLAVAARGRRSNHLFTRLRALIAA